MRCLFHRFGKWEDVKLGEKIETSTGWNLYFGRQIIKQQRRCARCNLVQTRYSA